MRFFTPTLRRLRHEDGGFSLMETVVALSVMFIALVTLAHTAAVGFTDIALNRQRTQANQIANKLLEQVRGLTYERVSKGLKTSDLAADANIVSCPGGLKYYLQCPSANPNAEEVVHLAAPGDDVPLVPHVQPFGPPNYTSNYTASVYVTKALGVPVSGAFRVTALVTWTPASRAGVKSSVTTQSLLYTPEGTTDASTGGGTAPFFYGTSSIGRAPITITPNPGVTDGTGVTGLPVWDSLTQDLYGLDASMQQQTLTRAESKAVLTGAHKVVSGVETVAGGDTAEATADDDPATPPTQDSSPAGLMQAAVSADVSGGGNALQVEAASGGGGIPCPSTQPSVGWMTGFEHGRGSSPMGTGNGGAGFLWGAFGNISIDSAVKRTGNYSLKLAPAGGATYGYYIGPTTNRVGVAHFAVRLASLPTGSNAPIFMTKVTGSSSNQVSFGFDLASGRWAVWQRTSGGVWQSPVTSSSTVSAGEWYSIDVRWTTTGATHTVDWQVNGVPQTQNSLSGQTAQNQYTYWFGYDLSGTTFTANVDDIVMSYTAADYPIVDGEIKALMPDGMGTSNTGGRLLNGNGSAIDSTTWTRLDEIPAAYSTFDDVIQNTAGTTNYVEVTLQNTTDTCIRAVEAFMFSIGDGGNKTNNGQYHILDGATDRTVWNGNLGPNLAASTVLVGMGGIVQPATAPWTQSAVNGLRARIGYSSDVSPNPYWATVGLQYYAPFAGEQPEGTAGTETGSTAASTAANAGTPCGNPTQVDGRACAFAREDYSTAGPPHLSARLDLTGSGAGKAKIYKFQPSTQSGSTSYVWGRRAAGGGGAGTIVQTAVRYPGSHEFGALPSIMGAGPTNWPGYWVKYDAGTSAASVTAEAGIGSAAPSFTSVGTISYYDQTCLPVACVRTMSPPTDGSQARIPVPSFSHTSGGWKLDICEPGDEDVCSLVSNASYTSQQPSGASGTTTRSEARAVLGTPIGGQFTYKLTNTSTGAVVVDLTISVDLGTLSALAKYAP